MGVSDQGAAALAYDPQTLEYYQRDAKTYAAHRGPIDFPPLMRFVESLPNNAKVLELGCGGGQDASILLKAGMDVTVTDGCPAMAELAARNLDRPVLVLRFDEIDAVAAYDAVWANACLLHAPAGALPAILGRIHRALRPEGLFCATFKGGESGARDTLGRYFNFMSAESLEIVFRESAPWRAVEVEQSAGRDFLGASTQWLVCRART